MRIHLSKIHVLVTSLLLISCGGNGGGGAPSIDDDGLCSDVAQVVCSNMYDCCSEGQIESFLAVDEPRTEKECRRDIRLRCEDSFAREFWSVQEGRSTLDENVRDCLATLEPTTTCFELTESLPSEDACDIDFWHGTLAAGESCFFDHECLDGSFCASNQTCTVLPAVGEECSNRGCAEGAYCEFSPDNVCAAFKTASEDCTSTNECAEGLFCDLNATSPTCAVLIASGEACAGNQECESFECIPGTCASNGSTCFDSDDCAGTCEGTGQFCNAQSTCQGRCSLNGNACLDAAVHCQIDETCDIPVCNLPECVGDVVCASEFLVIDYCDVAQSIL